MQGSSNTGVENHCIWLSRLVQCIFVCVRVNMSVLWIAKKQSYWTLRRKSKAKLDKQLQSMEALSPSSWREEYGGMNSDSSSTVDDNNDFIDSLSHINEPECVTMASASHSSESDTVSDTGSEMHPSSLNDDLATWATEHKITHVALNSLLSILRKHDLNMPKEARTLLGTVRSNRTKVQNKPGGQYYHFGLLESISGVLYSNMDIFLWNVSNLNLQVSIDGLPLNKSSATQFWPIL